MKAALNFFSKLTTQLSKIVFFSKIFFLVEKPWVIVFFFFFRDNVRKALSPTI